MERKSSFQRYSRLAQQLGIGSIIFGIVAALTKAWVTHWLGPSPSVADKVPPAAEVRPPETVEELLKASPVSLMNWQIAVEQRYPSDAARERQFREYIGKEVVWEGYFDQCNPLPADSPNAPGFIVVLHENRAALHSKSLLGPPFVRCWYPAEAEPALAKLSRGDWMVVKGRLKNPLLAGSVLCTDLNECSLVTTREVRDVELALPSQPVRR